MSDSKKNSGDLPPLQDHHFYLNEDGLMVFTREYHLERGFCCKSGCLHCPWNYRSKEAARKAERDRKIGPLEAVVRKRSDDSES